MANLTAPRNTPEFAPNNTLAGTAGATAYPGGMLCLNASGALVPAADSAGYKVAGRAENYASSGGAVTAKRGCFKWDNDSTSACSATDIGKLCYVVDDHTVGMGQGSNAVVAGTITGVDTDGVRVSMPQVLAGGTMGATASAISDLTGAPTSANINAILAALRTAGVIARS